VPANFYI